MNCHQIRKKLINYRAGESSLFETTLIQGHLENCPDCRHSYLELQNLDSLLDQWESLPAPSDLLTGVMPNLRQQRSVPGQRRLRGFPLLRDLAVAASAALCFIWLSSSWLDVSQVNKVGQDVLTVTDHYVQATSSARGRLVALLGSPGKQIHIEEWKK